MFATQGNKKVRNLEKHCDFAKNTVDFNVKSKEIYGKCSNSRIFLYQFPQKLLKINNFITPI